MALDVATVLPAALSALHARLAEDSEPEAALLYQQLACWFSATKYEGAAPDSFATLERLIRAFLRDAVQHLVLKVDATGTLVPWLVSDIERSTGHDARVTVRLDASVRGRRVADRIVFSRFAYRTVAVALAEHGCYRLSPELAPDCDDQRATARELGGSVGACVRVSGACCTVDGRPQFIASPEDAVIDDSRDDEPKQDRIKALPAVIVRTCFGGKSVVPPEQPYLRVYRLDRHEPCLVHVDRVALTEPCSTALDDIELPAKSKAVLSALAASQKTSTLTCCSLLVFYGPVGTGKTTTANAYARAAGRALLRVHCAQLGTSPDQLEERLGRYMCMAERWRAVLFIDEADAYVAPRTTDVHQNALVSVFLQVMDRHACPVIVASNKAVVDAAVDSRALYRVVFRLPNPEERRRIVMHHARLIGLELSDAEVDWIVRNYPKSGRDLVRLLQLGSTIKQRGPAFESVGGTFQYLLSPDDDVGGAGADVG